MNMTWNKIRINQYLESKKTYIKLDDESWVSVRNKHNWSCVFGHNFQRSFSQIQNSIKNYINPCTKCNPKSNNEEILRFILESMTLKKFPKRKPDWLIDDVTGNRLELDGYSEEIGLAFEYDGRQHQKHIKYFHPEKEDFIDQKRRDEIKDKIFNKMKIVLIRIKEEDNFVKDTKLILNKIPSNKLSVIINRDIDFSKYNSSNDYELIDRAKRYAESKGGECLSESISSIKDDVIFFCPKHQNRWKRRLDIILNRKQWCKECGYEKRIDKQKYKIDEFELQKICSLAKPKIKYLEWAGENEKDESLWECQNEKCEFPFKMKKNSLVAKLNKKINPCPSCNKKRRIKQWEAQRYAELMGGECLGSEDSKIGEFKFSCHNTSHKTFILRRSQIRFKVWCGRCKDGKKAKIHEDDVKLIAINNGYQLISQYKNNTTKLNLKCLNKECGKIRDDLNYRQLIKGGAKTRCDYCIKF